jgi:hypothetical protein
MERFLNCPDLVESELLLERLISEQSSPIVERIVTSRIRGSIGEDVRSDVLADLISRLRELKESGDRDAIRDFRAYSAVAAYHGCDKYYRRSFPQRYRLENQLRYLLGKHTRLGLWVAPDGEWTCGNRSWLRHQPVWTAHQKVVLWASSREAARLVEGILDECSAPLPFHNLVEQVARHWRISDTPASPSQGLVQPDPSVETKLAQRGWLRQVWSDIAGLPPAQRNSLLLNMRDDSGGAALPLLPVIGVASLVEIASMLEMSVEELKGLWDVLPLDDLRIAARLGLSRQQIIDLRRSARHRLNRLS